MARLVTRTYTIQKAGVTMGKVRWHTTMILDGFIAGPNDDMRWVFGFDNGAGETVDDGPHHSVHAPCRNPSL
jgi:hypothetical protein